MCPGWLRVLPAVGLLSGVAAAGLCVLPAVMLLVRMAGVRVLAVGHGSAWMVGGLEAAG